MIDRAQQSPRQPNGVTLLLVVLILSLVSGISVAVTTLILRQFEQGADARGAVIAQNAADSGVERVLYRVKTGRSGLPSAFISALAAEFGCKTNPPGAVIGDATFCTDEEQSYETEDAAVAALDEYETLTIDMYNPEGSATEEITALKISGTADPGTWLEVSWAAWDASSGEFVPIGSATKEFFDAAEISTERYVYMKKKELLGPPEKDIYFLNDPNTSAICTADPGQEEGCYCTTTDALTYPNCAEVVSGTSHLNYIVRIRPLFGNVQEVRVETMKNCVSATGSGTCSSVPIPARISVKVVGEFNSLQQAVKISVPWRFATAGLFDYVLLAEEGIVKRTQLTPGFQNSGTVEAEVGTSFTSEAEPNRLPQTPFDCLLGDNGIDPLETVCGTWDVVKDATIVHPEMFSSNVRCQREVGIDASGGGTCGFDMKNDDGTALPVDQPPRITYSLEPYQLGEEDATGVLRAKTYYVNARFRVTSQSQDEAVNIGYLRTSDGYLALTGYYRDPARVPPYSQWFDEAKSPGLPSYTDNPYYHRDKDGWVLCSYRATLSSEYYLQFRANDDYQTQATPRLDWWRVSTLPFTEKPGTCEFVGEWDYDNNESIFLDAIEGTPEQTVDGLGNPEQEFCNCGWGSPLGAPTGCYYWSSPPPWGWSSCVEFGTPTFTPNMSTWLGYNNMSIDGTYFQRSTRCNEPAYVVGVTPLEDTTGRCTYSTGSAGLDNKMPFKTDSVTWKDIPEGNYYLIMHHDGYTVFNGSAGDDAFLFDIDYADTVINASNDATSRMLSEGTSAPDSPGACYFDEPFRVISGMWFGLLMNTTSAGNTRYIDLDQIELTRTEPTTIPQCP